jgi:poly-gamma-glutamate capsule biosynthesis protein CapA/YwtB (metallophosphatase superfamily)
VSSNILMGFVGDVHVNRDSPREIFTAVSDVLGAPRVMFANLEGAYTDNPQQLSQFGLCCSPTHTLDIYREVGFNVMSLANNHVADAGYDSMLKSRSSLRSQGIQTCGAGDSILDAREPAIVDVDGLRIAFLAYASIFPLGWEARSNAPGLVPMRAYNAWREVWPTYHAPGMRPLITTVPDQKDLAYLTDDIQRARGRADLVITSFHWGDQTCLFDLTDHEIRTARHCIDQGAHMVVGHHHHSLRGMEWYKNRPIMYGLGHFVFDVRWEWSEEEVRKFAETESGRYFKQVHYDGGPRKDWPLLPFPEEFRMNVVAWANASLDGINEIGFLPCSLTPDGVVHPRLLDSLEGRKVISYLDQCNKTQGLNGLIVSPGSVFLGGYETVRVVPS